jgi:hypothetical protein
LETRHAVIVTAAKVDPDGVASDMSPSPFGELDFVDERASVLREVLEHDRLGYAVDALPQAGPEALRKVDDALHRRVGLLHFLGHGFVRAGALHFVPATGGFGRTTNLAFLSEELNARASEDGSQFLLVLDLCHAEEGLATRSLGGIKNVWIACAAGDQRAYHGWFSQALAETLADLASGAIDVDSSFEFMSMDRFRSEFGKRYGRIINDHRHQRVPRPEPYFLGRFTNQAQAGVGEVPFFPNPRFDPAAVERRWARDRIEAGLHPFLDVPHFADRTGRHFTGRSSILDELGQWRTGKDRSAGLKIVTGAAGSGKSAIVGAIVLTCHPAILTTGAWSGVSRALRVRLPASCRITVPGSVAAVHARRRRFDEVLRGFIDQLHGQGDPALDKEQVRSVVDLTEWIGRQSEPPLLVIDALDEAVDPQNLVHVLLRPLLVARRGDQPACRVLVAGRGDTERNRALLGLLEDVAVAPSRIDLDTHDEGELTGDLEAFLTEAIGDDHRCCDRRLPGFAAMVARALVDRTEMREYGPFLVAGLYANLLRRRGHLGDDPRDHLPADPALAASRVPASLPEVLELDFERLDPVERRRRRAVLAALAYSRGDGMPGAIAGLLAGQVFGGGECDAAELLHESAEVKVYLRNATDPEGVPLYRLFHQSLDDYLRVNPIEGVGTS